MHLDQLGSELKNIYFQKSNFNGIYKIFLFA